MGFIIQVTAHTVDFLLGSQTWIRFLNFLIQTYRTRRWITPVADLMNTHRDLLSSSDEHPQGSAQFIWWTPTGICSPSACRRFLLPAGGCEVWFQFRLTWCLLNVTHTPHVGSLWPVETWRITSPLTSWVQCTFWENISWTLKSYLSNSLPRSHFLTLTNKKHICALGKVFGFSLSDRTYCFLTILLCCRSLNFL